VTDADVHLFSSVDQSLLYWWDTLFFFYALLYAGDLWLSVAGLFLCAIALAEGAGAGLENRVLWI